MRPRITTLLLVPALFGFLAGSANAAILFELELLGSPGVNAAAPGSNVDIAVFVTPGPEGVSHFMYDVVTTSGVAVAGSNQPIVLGGSDSNCPATSLSDCNMSELGPPTLAGNAITDFNLATLGVGPTGGRYQVGVARFNFAGPDTVTLNVTMAIDNAIPGQPISPVNTMTFIVPEPTTASLLGLGLGALALVGRRARRPRARERGTSATAGSWCPGGRGARTGAAGSTRSSRRGRGACPWDR